MKKRDTIILVVLAHIGLVLIWVTMGGCSFTRSSDKGDELEVAEMDVSEEELIIPDSDSGLIINDSEPLLADEPADIVPSGPTLTTAGETEYVVQKGDSLWSISRKYKVSINDIKARNSLQGTLIRAGEVLIIPAGGVAAEPAAAAEAVEAAVETAPLPVAEETATAAVETVPEEAALETAAPQYAEHTVVSGDTIWKLARQYNTTETKIMELNNITDPRRIQIGQKLKIPKN